MYSLLWVMVLAMLIMSIVLLTGKGSGLIAGYNTASTEKRLKYDEKKLCHTMGGGLLILTISLAVLMFVNFQFSSKIAEYIFIGIIIIDILMMLILGNTVCRRQS